MPEHPMFAAQFAEWKIIQDEIEIIIPRVIADEDLEHEQNHVNNPECDQYFHKPLIYARDHFMFYMCHRCHRCHHPFYGGHADCGGVEQAPEEYVCARCSRQFAQQTDCPIHGDQGMLFKCFWCCKPGLFFCWGTTHFCAECHLEPIKAQKGPWTPCDGKCQFHPHPENGTKQIFGYCTICEEERMRRSKPT
jgi:E3 ubiquitin-protein ligase MYCBP2